MAPIEISLDNIRGCTKLCHFRPVNTEHLRNTGFTGQIKRLPNTGTVLF